MGDKVIIAAYAALEDHEIHTHEPRVLLVDDRNRVTLMAPAEPAGL